MSLLNTHLLMQVLVFNNNYHMAHIIPNKYISDSIRNSICTIIIINRIY